MDSNQPNQTAKSNWKQKGQGWIPDYPDLRDRRLIKDKELHQSGSLTQKDEGKDFALLQEVVSDLLNALQEIPGKPGGEKLQKGLGTINGKISAFKTQLSGDITFLPVKVHRILRQTSKSLSPYASSDFIYEDELPQRISELNMCLYLLYKNRQLKQEDVQEEDVPKPSDLIKNDFTDLIKTIKWLRDGKFTQETEALVKAFQRLSKATVDGIVGLETYTAYREKIKTNVNTSGISSGSQPTKPYIELVSLTPLLPQENVEDIFKVLKSWAIKQISADLSKNSNNRESGCVDDDLYEIKTPEKIGKEETEPSTISTIFRDYFAEDVNPSIDEWKGERKSSDSTAEEIIKKILRISPESNPEFKEFYQLYRAEYLLLEPIVSIILKIIGPCGRFRNYPLKSILAKGIQTLETLMELELPSSQEGRSKGIDNITEKLNHDVTPDLALQLMAAADNALDFKLESFKRKEKYYEEQKKLFSGKKDDHSEQNSKKREEYSKLFEKYSKLVEDLKDKDKKTLGFCFLVKKAIKWLESKKQFSNESNNKKKDSAFGRDFHLQIIKPGSESDDEELVRFATLQIPVSTSQFYDSLEEQNLFDDTTPEPFTFLPGVVDLSYWCSEIEDQKNLNSCTAFAGIALLEYFANKSSGKYTDLSPLFLYKVTRTLINLTDDIGASVRATMKAMVTFGVAPEEYWPYDADKVNEEPPAFCYSFAEAYKALRYFRLDYAGISKETLLLQIKAVLSAGFPCMFGFTLYTSAERAENASQGAIPFPAHKKDKVVGGHAVVAVGYDDYKEIYRTDRDAPSIGALLIRNSLGANWGCKGYGWLPYDYVLAGLTGDWWSLLKAEWFENDIFWVGNTTGKNDGGTCDCGMEGCDCLHGCHA